MIRVALKGLAGRKLRAVLTALAVVIGVSMVSGTYVLTDTMQKAFDGIFESSYDETDVVVAGRQVVESSNSGTATVPASLLPKLKALPEVGAAGGTIGLDEANESKLIGKDGKPIGGAGGAPNMGMGYDAANPQFSPLKLKAGDWPQGRGEVAIDAGSAEKGKFRVGDPIKVATLGETQRYRITGIARFGDVDSIGGATIAVFDLPTAQAVLHKEGRYDGISLAAKEGTSPRELAAALKPQLPANVEAKVSADQAAADAKDTDEGLKIIRYFLLGFGGIALFVGAFVIFNTLSITVAQRTREFATLRTLGASRRQVLRSVVLEGLVIGALASVLGLVAGLGIAKGLNALFVSLGVDLPNVGTVLALRTVIVSLTLGTVITVLSSLMPAVRATRVPPIAAVREGAELPPSRLAKYSGRTASGVIGVSVAAVALGLFAGDSLGTGPMLLLLGGGVIGLFLGVALIAPRLVRPLASVLSWPARRIGGAAGRLAGANAARNPARTASTAAALMIGLALVTFVAVLGNGLRDSVDNAVSDQLRADYVVDGPQDDEFSTFPTAAGDAIEQAPGVAVASSVRSDQARLRNGDEIAVTGIEPASIAGFYTFDWEKGSDADLGLLGSSGAVVTESFADDQKLAVGERFGIETPSGAERTLVVKAVYSPPELDPLLGAVSIPTSTFDSAFPAPKNSFTFVDAEPGASAQPLAAALAPYDDAGLHTGAKFSTDRTSGFSDFLDLLYVMLAFSVIVSLFGMVNTLVLSVFERTRELGMLRAVGMTRRQARRMVRHESVITALIGAALGLPVGIFLAALVTQALSKYGVGIAIPVGSLVVFAFVAVLAGIAAAIWPARRAARLNPLEALQYE